MMDNRTRHEKRKGNRRIQGGQSEQEGEKVDQGKQMMLENAIIKL